MLEAQGVYVRLGGHPVLRGVDVAVEAGSVLGLLGPSGAGKTTLFRVLSGELAADSGRVELAGQYVSDKPLWVRARRGLGYVPQTPSVLTDLSVRDNLRAFEHAAGVEPMAPEERAALVELEGRLEVRAGELSGGERRRLELLRALVAKPKVLLCDEPLTGVDPTGIHRVGRILRQAASEGMAVLLADHRVHDALALCDAACLLLDGRIELSAEPETFLDHPEVRKRYLG